MRPSSFSCRTTARNRSSSATARPTPMPGCAARRTPSTRGGCACPSMSVGRAICRPAPAYPSWPTTPMCCPRSSTSQRSPPRRGKSRWMAEASPLSYANRTRRSGARDISSCTSCVPAARPSWPTSGPAAACGASDTNWSTGRNFMTWRKIPAKPPTWRQATRRWSASCAGSTKNGLPRSQPNGICKRPRSWSDPTGRRKCVFTPWRRTPRRNPRAGRSMSFRRVPT